MEENIHVHFDTRPPELSRGRRMQIPIIAWMVYWAIRAIGPTLRFEVLGWRNAQRVYDGGKRVIAIFWHRSIFSATWWWRNTGIVVMNTTNFDGQWTRRVIERLDSGPRKEVQRAAACARSPRWRGIWTKAPTLLSLLMARAARATLPSLVR